MSTDKTEAASISVKLTEQLKESLSVPLDKHKKWVIFSDLHMGDGGSTDDFRVNSQLFCSALDRYYATKNFALVLNGDVEELQRSNLSNIVKRWPEVYQQFDAFYDRNALYKIVGNHDLELLVRRDLPYRYPHHESLRLNYQNDSIFIFHGHQASKKYQRHNELIGFTLKYFANPLGIKSYSVSHSSKKQYKIEKRVYRFSASQKVVSIIGHTHRPLFESLHKVERLRFKIEQLCRDYARSSEKNLLKIQEEIIAHKKELKKHHQESGEQHLRSYLYNTLYHIPCVFNSGCVVGKRGMTCLEIEGDKIRLVHWFDKNISRKYLRQSGYQPEQLDDTNFYRLVINEESLKYIFTRIKLLS
ncbi:MAG: metallophosphoesterase [Bacteroidota bacterium]